jgi:hypothetical protein
MVDCFMANISEKPQGEKVNISGHTNSVYSFGEG